MKKITRDNVYISNSNWCLIQTFALLAGVVLFWCIGALITVLTGFLDCTILSVLVWISVFYRIKFIVEEEFSDCIEV